MENNKFHFQQNQLTFVELGEQKAKPHHSKRPKEGEPRLKKAFREQFYIGPTTIDGLVPDNHIARSIWKYCNSLNLKEILTKIKSVEGNVGRPAVDPKILLAIWFYALNEGIGQASTIAKYCKEHAAFQWLCGNVNVSERTISSFRVEHGKEFENLLVQSVAVFRNNNLASFDSISQDGMRTRGSAGTSSFRTKKKLKKLIKEAEADVKRFFKAIKESPNGAEKKKLIRMKSESEKKERNIKNALCELNKIKKETTEKRKEYRKKKLTKDEVRNLRSSKTDPDARIMRMPDGGFRPGYNVQFASTTKDQIVIGVDVSKSGSDGGLAKPMMDKVAENYEDTPKNWLIDGGYKKFDDIEYASEKGIDVYMPPQMSAKGKKQKNPYLPLERDSKAIAEWRLRMGTESAKTLYKERAATSECVNAQARNRSLYRFYVRGRDKVKGVANLFGIVHNMKRAFTLGLI